MSQVWLVILCTAVLTGTSASRLISLHVLSRPTVRDGPPFCHGHECPPFTVLESTSRYQLRQYEDAKYVETTIEGSGASAAVTKGYTRLFRYISGNNVDNAKIDMTSPVIIFERSSDGFKSAEKNYTIAFYLPQQFQGEAPAPKNNAINIIDVPGATLYVKEFGGFVSAGRLISPSDLGLPSLGDAPDFCHGLECPPFKLLKNTSQYQLREYEGAKFVGTTIEGSNLEVAITKGFTKLFKYISGNNVDNAKISMTTPVITFVKPSADFKTAEKNYTIAFYLPQQFQGEAPAPKDDEVNIVDAPGVTVYVKVFGGFGTGGSVLKEAAELHQDLTQDKKSFKDARIIPQP
ncbi:hypothetical protein WJX79_009551 [Trebouxia sp. C0005]